jgi:hypothetical protein
MQEFNIILPLPLGIPTFNYILKENGQCIQVFWKPRKWISKEEVQELWPNAPKEKNEI